MVNKKLLFSVFFLFMGLCMQAQSVSEGQMDERFNDGDKMPYGWFTKGWEVKDGVVKKKSSQGFDMNSLMGGGGSGFNYLMTPPVQAQAGETLVFSARKGEATGLGAMMGGGNSDSTFVVEQSVYGAHLWQKVADFTTQMESDFKTFSVSVAESGTYRFRFRAAGEVDIDSVAGFHVDNEAPDILVIRDTTKVVSYIDLGLCDADTTTLFNVFNTATGTLKAIVSSTENSLFTVSASELTVAAGEKVSVEATFKYSGAKAGRNDAFINFDATDERVSGLAVNMVAIVSDPQAWVEDFNASNRPEGWFTEGWGFQDQTAVVTSSSGSMGPMAGGGGGSFYLMTPVLTVNDTFETLLFSVRNAAGGGGMGAMMGGGGPSLTIEKSVYGSNKWENVATITENVDSAFKTMWVSGITPGDYRFRFVTTDSIAIDSIAGFRLNGQASDLYVTLDSAVVRSVNYGMPQANSTKTFIVMNTASNELQVNVASTNETAFTVNPSSFSISAGDSVKVDVTFDDAAAPIGENHAIIMFTPADERLMAHAVSVEAYKTYPDAWSEDFEPMYVIEDESIALDLPEWQTTGWKIVKPSGGGMMAMFGGGGGAPKTWMATTDSPIYELVTPSLQAKKGDVLQFLAEMGGGNTLPFMAMMGGGSGLLNVFYSKDEGKTWTYYNSYTQTGLVYFKAPFSGIYNLKFTGASVSLDNFLGFKRPMEDIVLVDSIDNSEALETYKDKNMNVTYDRVLSAHANADGSWTPVAYTLSLPYTLNFTDYADTSNMKLYQLSYIDNYYKQFIFSEVPAIAEAGKGYLAVIERDSVALNAIDVTITNAPAVDASVEINDYEDWYLKGETKALGNWLGTFTGISGQAEDAKNVYGLKDDGSWTPLGEGTLNAFRAFFQANQEMAEKYDRRASANDAGSYRTMFHQPEADDSQENTVSDRQGLLFVGDLRAAMGGTTGIAPTIHTIDSDGTHRYYDLQGRQLSSKPQKGIYIENGIKRVAK